MDSFPSITPRASPSFEEERDRRLRLAAWFGLWSRPLSLLVPLATVPIMVRYLGPTGYGEFEAIVALGSWLSLSNVGLGLSLLNRLSVCFVNGDDDSAQLYIGSMMFGLAGVMAAAAVVWLISVPFLARIALDDRSTDSSLGLALGLAGLFTLFGLYVNVVTPIYAAYQESHKLFVWDAIAKIGILIALLFVPLFGYGLLGAITATLLVPSLVRLASLVWLLTKDKPTIRPRFRHFEVSVFRVLARDGILFALLQASVILNFEADKAILSAIEGPHSVATYSVTGKGYLAVYSLYIVILSPLWGAYAEASVRGEYRWIRARIRLTTFGGIGLVVICGVGLVTVRESAVFLAWLGDPALIPSVQLIVVMGGAFAVRAFIDARAVALNAAGVLRPQVLLLGVHGIANVVTSIFLVQLFGTVGVLLATIITALASSCWIYPVLVRRSFRTGVSSRSHATETGE